MTGDGPVADLPHRRESASGLGRGETAGVTFGQRSGPPASAKQIQHLAELLEAAGHVDFRDARGPMGFTQRQAAGKFSREEADAFIEQLERARDEEPGQAGVVEAPARLSAADRALRSFSTDQLAAELQRRGWIVIEP